MNILPQADIPLSIMNPTAEVQDSSFEIQISSKSDIEKGDQCSTTDEGGCFRWLKWRRGSQGLEQLKEEVTMVSLMLI